MAHVMAGLRMERILVRVAATLSLIAAAIHAGVIQQHLKEWWGYGYFFIFASLGQGLYGLVLFALPKKPSWPAAEWLRFRTRLYGLGIAGNAAIIALYLVTRTVGIPFFGPGAGEVEEIGTIDYYSKAAELVTIVALAACIAFARRGVPADVAPAPP